MSSSVSAFVHFSRPIALTLRHHRHGRRTSPAMTATSAAASSPPAFVSDVLTFWYGTTTPGRFETFKSQRALWYSGKPEIDTQIRTTFSTHVSEALEGSYDHLLDISQHGFHPTLAVLILLDQFPRNMHRGTPKAFMGDSKTKKIVHDVISHPTYWTRAATELPAMVRMTLMLPLMHQECLADQEFCVAELQKMSEELEGVKEEAGAEECAKAVGMSLDFGKKHRDIILEFGRFPYRNSVLGRGNTPAEEQFLLEGPRFGQ